MNSLIVDVCSQTQSPSRSHQASRKKIRTVRFSSLTSIFPSRASHPTAIETVDRGALTPFSTAVRLDSPLERKKFHTRPAVSPIVLISTIKTSLAIVWHFNAGFQILAQKIFFLRSYVDFFKRSASETLLQAPAAGHFPIPISSLPTPAEASFERTAPAPVARRVRVSCVEKSNSRSRKQRRVRHRNCSTTPLSPP